jgi:hypothetical protein
MVKLAVNKTLFLIAAFEFQIPKHVVVAIINVIGTTTTVNKIVFNNALTKSSFSQSLK